MNRRSASMLATLSASVAMLVIPAAASAANISGTVVQRNVRTHSFVIANGAGHLSEIHARREPAIGRRVSVTASRLRNGTWSAHRMRQGRVQRSARISGTVTYSSARSGTFVVSARGVSLLVRRNSGHRSARVLGRAAAAASPTIPAVGTTVTVSTQLTGGSVTATQVTDDGINTNGIDLEGIVQSVDTTARTISISADDSEQSSAGITVQVPASFDISQFQAGDKVELIASLNPDGSYTLEQASGDGSIQQADNPGDQQGSVSSDQQPSAAQQCDAQQADPNFAATHNGETFAQYYAVNPNELSNAFGDCVDALSADGGGQSSPQMQCLVQRSDPNFPAAHNGETFLQYYSTNPNEINPGDAFGHCIDLMHQAGSQSDGGGSTGGSGD